MSQSWQSLLQAFESALGELPESMDSEDTLAAPVERKGVESFLASAGAFDPGDLPAMPKPKPGDKKPIPALKEFPPVKIATHKDTKGVLDVHSLADKDPKPMQLAGQSVQRREVQVSASGYEIVVDENTPPKDWTLGPDQWKQAVQNVKRQVGITE